MVITDANLLIYANDDTSPYYVPSRDWLEASLSADEDFGIPMQAILAFIRISTNARLWIKPITMQVALSRVDTWLRQPQALILNPGPGHWTLFAQLCRAANLTGKLTTDAHFAALAIENGATLCSADADFARFPGLRWVNPLA